MIANNNPSYSGYNEVNRVEERRKAKIMPKLVSARVVMFIRNFIIL